MKVSWWVAAAATAVLLLAVVLVRPGSQATPAQVAAPGPAADTRGPAGLAGLGLSDLPVTATGVGPLSLGDDLAELVAAGWSTYDAGDGCVRLLPQDLADVSLGGWAVAGRVASLQLEAGVATVDPVASELGFSFGAPVSEAPAQQLQVLPVGDRSRSVTTARFDTDAGRVLVSDVGGTTVRFAEVATPAGEACTLDADLLESSTFPSTSVALSTAAAAVTPADLGHRYLSSSGSTLDQLGSLGTWDDQLAGLDGQGCETLVHAADGDRVTLFVLDGVVVAEDYVLDTGPLRTPPYYFPGEAFQETTDGRLVRIERLEAEQGGPADWGSTLRTRWLVELQAVPEIDSVVVSAGPVVELQQVGRPCRAAAR
ncbi:hypothetical protein [Jannaschia sp. R86511]|uniref:hypothetical protein n=1 Tax=Jannaschia sp. R86511 TaxID=3093853 RepID=UPI0036D378AE